ncbi:methylated-DNA--[protein]-cysteine S-methyltransferase [Marinobacterium sp. AK62]|uniref:Methylated-DNA--protein-cysteine methyltransferase n=1 Tax=Marinobacterium alkalitolerans TaxID=1542925 RepID=A0ABS3ZFP2_9GAMM|nr:methylated-DNA--[protein]-cysteine S-methyltransferase [Marinobacterium alkalitolerans]MBP0050128.1 methylated-DNA--[protein]-cysteine S-methyltransferase [Marinobacterium alkalitolerans]
MIHTHVLMDTPVGPLTLQADNEGICRVDFGLRAEPTGVTAPTALLQACVDQLQAYFAGALTTFDLPLNPVGTPFQGEVWTALQQIPHGEVRSYGDIARAIERPQAFRAVGLANNRNPISIIIPCHRVVGSNGELTGYGGGLDIKIRLLELENITLASAASPEQYRVLDRQKAS